MTEFGPQKSPASSSRIDAQTKSVQSEIEGLRMLTFRQVATMMGVSHPTVSKLVKKGYLKAEVPPGLKSQRIRQSEVLRYMRQ